MGKEEETKVEDVEPSVEDEKKVEEVKEPEPKKSEEEGAAFEKEKDTVSVNKYNQMIRKQRETELKLKAFEDKAEKVPKKIEKKVVEKEESFFDDIEDFEDEDEEKTVDPADLVDEKLKPVLAQLKQHEDDKRKEQRTQFFDAHPEYLNDSEKWSGLLDELKDSINPNSSKTYFEQLEKAHILFSGENVAQDVIDDKKKEMAGDAASGSDGAEKTITKGEFTAEDRDIMKQWDISEDGMRAAKAKLESGDLRILQ